MAFTLVLPWKERVVVLRTFLSIQWRSRSSLKKGMTNNLKSVTAFLVLLMAIRVLLKNRIQVL